VECYLELLQLGLNKPLCDPGVDPPKDLSAEGEHLVPGRGALDERCALVFGVGDAMNVPERLKACDGLSRRLLGDPEPASEFGNRDAVWSDGLQREPMDGARSGMASVGELVMEFVDDRSKRPDQ
jgi:hypothetical protein